MTPEDLELVISVTKHERYRELTDPAHPDYHETVSLYVQRLAESFRTGEPIDGTGIIPVRVPEPPVLERLPEEPRPTLAEMQHSIALRDTCIHWSRCKTGCGADDCTLKGKVTIHTCVACIAKNAGFSPRDTLSRQNPLQLPPPSEPRPMPDGIIESPATMQDLIANVAAYKLVLQADTIAVAQAAKALSDANTTQQADQTGSDSASSQLGDALNLLKTGVGVTNPDGTTTAYEPNGSGGVVIRTLQPPSIPIPTS